MAELPMFHFETIWNFPCKLVIGHNFYETIFHLHHRYSPTTCTLSYGHLKLCLSYNPYRPWLLWKIYLNYCCSWSYTFPSELLERSLYFSCSDYSYRPWKQSTFTAVAVWLLKLCLENIWKFDCICQQLYTMVIIPSLYLRPEIILIHGSMQILFSSHFSLMKHSQIPLLFNSAYATLSCIWYNN